MLGAGVGAGVGVGVGVGVGGDGQAATLGLYICSTLAGAFRSKPMPTHTFTTTLHMIYTRVLGCIHVQPRMHLMHALWLGMRQA